MSAFSAKLFISFVKRHFGICVLSLILFFVSLATIKPGFYIIGWDNYSSYFNSGTNIFRTFFHVWRSYRGLGVPSDSESTDIFRQIFSFILHFIFAESLVDQLYIVFCLWLGVIGMYVIAKRMFRHISHSPTMIELAATCGGLFYLFNLNTLAMFYFPIITYITRFAAIPLIFLLFYELIHRQHISKKFVIFSCIIFLFTSGSFITGTVFITTLMSLSVFLLFQGKRKRSISVFVLYIVINAFWLLPFVNYTKEKSDVIRLAPTFIDANESQLNKGKSFYDPLKQFILFPNFFDTQYDLISTQQKQPFHPMASEFRQPYIQLMVLIFPVLYILGSVSIFLLRKKGTAFLWIPLLIGGYLFLSLKEYSPLGFIYHWMDLYLPYFGVLFRFGDTKFHPYIAFAGSIASGLFLLLIYSGWKRVVHVPLRRLFVIPLIVVVIVSIVPYWRYFSEGMLGFFMYVDLPPAYGQVAKIINDDPKEGRVLHLPFDKDQYWKSYSWGSLGSAFFQYMLDKPLIDKTFEPASMENAYLHKRISDITWGTQLLPEAVKEKHAEEFYNLLVKTGVSYIVLDESVSSYIPSKGIIFGGNYNTLDISALIKILLDKGKVEEKTQIPITQPIYPQSLSRGTVETTFTHSLRLYTLMSSSSVVSFPSSAEGVDREYKNLLEHESLPSNTLTLQSTKEENANVYPFRRDDGELRIGNSLLSYSLPLSDHTTSSMTVNVPRSNQKIISVTNKLDKNDIVFTFYWVYLPTINGQQYRLPIGEKRIPLTTFQNINRTSSTYALSDWQTLGLPYSSGYRLVVNDVVVPFTIPTLGEQEIGTVFSQDNTLQISFLEKNETKSIDLSSIRLTEQVNCFGDALSSYSSSLERTTSGLKVISTNGSTCFWTDLSTMLQGIPYGELRANIQGSNEPLDTAYVSDTIVTGKPLLRKYIQKQKKINTLRVCVAQGDGGDCFNKHQLLNLPEEETEILIPFEQLLRTPEQMSVVFALKPIGYQSQSVQFSSVLLDSYNVIEETTIDSYPDLPASVKTVPVESTLTLEMPYGLSPYSYVGLSSKDLPYLSNKPCESSQGYRTFSTVHDNLLSYVENCYNELYTDLRFDNSSFLLWGTEYYLHSGKYPKLFVQDKLLRYRDKYASVYQGYPDIPGFKNLQTPEYFFSSADSLIRNIEEVPLITTSLFLAPDGGDTRRKQFSLLSHAENEGVISFGKTIIAALPPEWRNISISDEFQNKTFAAEVSATVRTITPSFRVVKLHQQTNDKEFLLRFDEAYDPQWKLIGTGMSVTDHARCDGYANCFTVRGAQAEAKLYLIYLPEILNLLGWGITALILCISPFIFSRKG